MPLSKSKLILVKNTAPLQVIHQLLTAGGSPAGIIGGGKRERGEKMAEITSPKRAGSGTEMSNANAIHQAHKSFQRTRTLNVF